MGATVERPSVMVGGPPSAHIADAVIEQIKIKNGLSHGIARRIARALTEKPPNAISLVRNKIARDGFSEDIRVSFLTQTVAVGDQSSESTTHFRATPVWLCGLYIVAIVLSAGWAVMA